MSEVVDIKKLRERSRYVDVPRKEKGEPCVDCANHEATNLLVSDMARYIMGLRSYEELINVFPEAESYLDLGVEDE